MVGTEPVERILAVMPLGGAPRTLAKVAIPEQMFLQSWLSAGDEANLAQANPAGSVLAYTANEAGWDLWVMEHFLPPAGRR